ncbi:MAG: ribonuclease HII [Bacteroidales bacterium]|jgi:ribonuclease HII|nr:ribonuclease HII [Bacteroidales bacterium]
MLLPFLQEGRIEAGCDEAGRGCLAGPVFAAAVVTGADFDCPEINDSKQLSARQRYRLRAEIEKQALAWAVGSASPDEIDKINILNAALLAMHRAVLHLKLSPDYLLIDGNRYRRPSQLPMCKISANADDFAKIEPIPVSCFVKGDGRFVSIAAASILAKTYRDDYMLNLHRQYPQYAWNKNQGYPTAEHRRAIADYGISPFHRKTFRLLPVEQQLSLF